MDQASPHAKPYRRTAVVRGPTSAEEEETASNASRGKRDEDEDPLLFLSKPTGWVVSTITIKAELISAAVLSLCSPFVSLFYNSRAVPARVAHSAANEFRGVTFGLLGAAYAVTSLVVIMALAFLLSVFLVRLWVEEPILLRRPLHFDYTQPQPGAAAMLGRVGTKVRAVPAGHMVSLALKLVMPESDFNRNVGIFQVEENGEDSTSRFEVDSDEVVMLLRRVGSLLQKRSRDMASSKFINLSLRNFL